MHNFCRFFWCCKSKENNNHIAKSETVGIRLLPDVTKLTEDTGDKWNGTNV